MVIRNSLLFCGALVVFLLGGLVLLWMELGGCLPCIDSQGGRNAQLQRIELIDSHLMRVGLLLRHAIESRAKPQALQEDFLEIDRSWKAIDAKYDEYLQAKEHTSGLDFRHNTERLKRDFRASTHTTMDLIRWGAAAGDPTKAFDHLLKKFMPARAAFQLELDREKNRQYQELLAAIKTSEAAVVSLRLLVVVLAFFTGVFIFLLWFYVDGLSARRDQEASDLA